MPRRRSTHYDVCIPVQPGDTHGVPTRYEDSFTPAVTSALVSWYRFRKGMTLDEALREVDALDKFLREYK